MGKMADSPEDGYAKGRLNNSPEIAQAFATVKCVHFT